MPIHFAMNEQDLSDGSKKKKDHKLDIWVYSMTTRKCCNSFGMCESSIIIDELSANSDVLNCIVLTTADIKLSLLPLENVLIRL